MTTSEVESIRRDRKALEDVLRDNGVALRGKACKCPFHDDRTPSAGIYEKDSVWRFACHVCKISEDVIGLKARFAGTTSGSVLKAEGSDREQAPPPRVFPTVAAMLDSVRAYANVVAHWQYTYAGKVDMVVIRCHDSNGKKSFLQARPHASGFIMRGPNKPLPIYNRTRVAAASDVVVCEGEKCVHLFHDHGVTATTSPGGAGKAKDADWSMLSGKANVYLWPDNDDTGRKHMRDVQAILTTLPNAPKVWWVPVEEFGLPPKGDVEQYLELFGTEAQGGIPMALSAAQPTGPAQSVAKLINDTISGARTSIDWFAPLLTELTQSLTPGAVTLVCGDGGSTKTWFVIQNCIHWQKQGILFALRELEEDEDGYTLNRVMAQLEGDGNVSRIPWVRANPDEARKVFDRHSAFLDQFGKSLWAIPGDMPSLDEVENWIRDRAKEGRRVIVVDPITAADSDDKPWIADKKFIRNTQSIMRDYQASLVLVTHPKQNRKSATPTMDEVAGGSAYQRFTQNIFWLSRIDDEDEMEVKAWSSVAGWQTQYTHIHRRIRVFKARNGSQAGFDLGYKFGSDLQFLECGILAKKSK